MPVAKKSKIEGMDKDPDIAFMRLLWAVDHELQRVSKRMEKSVGITGPQRLVLLLLSQTPSMSAGQLASDLHIHPSTLTGILARLLRKNMISRASDSSDARRTVLTLREPGRRLVSLREGTVEEAVRMTLRKFSSGEIETAARVQRALATHLAVDPAWAGPRKRGKKLTTASAR